MQYRNLCLLLLIIHCAFVFGRTSSPSPTPSPLPHALDCVLLAGGDYIQSAGYGPQKYSILAYNITTQKTLDPPKADTFLPKGVYSNGIIDNFISSNANLIFAGKFQKVKNEYSNSIGNVNLEIISNETTINGMQDGVWNVGYQIPSPDTIDWPSLVFTNWTDGRVIVAGPFTIVESIGNNMQGIVIYDEHTSWLGFPNTYQLCSNCQIISVVSSTENLFAVTMSTDANFETELYSFSISSSTWHKFASLVTPTGDSNKLLRIAVNTLTINSDQTFLFAIGYSSSVSSPSIYDPVLNFYLLTWDISDLSSPATVRSIWQKDCNDDNLRTFPKISAMTGSNNVVVAVPNSPCSAQVTSFRQFSGTEEVNGEDSSIISINELKSINFFVATDQEGEYFISDSQYIYHYVTGHWIILNLGVDQLGYSSEYMITSIVYNKQYSRLYFAVRYLVDNETSVLFWPYHNWENLLFTGEIYQPGSIHSMITISNNTQVLMGGNFQYVDRVKANSLVLWNGTNWVDQGISKGLTVNTMAQLNDVVYALIYDPLDDNYKYGTAFPLYYLVNGQWKLMENTPIINLPEGQTSFGMANTRALYAHATSQTLFVGGDFYVLLQNGQTARGLMSYSPQTKQWSGLGLNFDQVNSMTVLEDQVLEIGGKFTVTVNGVTNINIASYSLSSKSWNSCQSTTMEIRTIARYRHSTSVAGGSNPHSQTSSVSFYDYYYNHWTSSPSLPNTTNSLSAFNDAVYAGGSYGVAKLDRNGSKWSYVTSTVLYVGDVYSTLILCNASSFIPQDNSTNGNNDQSSYTSAIYEIDCNDPTFKDNEKCSTSTGGGTSIWGIAGLVAAVIFTIVVVGVVGVLFYIQKVKKAEHEVEFI